MADGEKATHLDDENPEWYFEPTAEKRSAAYAFWRVFVGKRSGMYLLGLASVLLTNFMQVLSSRSLGWTLDFFTKDELPQWLVGTSPESTLYRLIFLLVVIRICVFIGRWGWRMTFARQTHFASAELKRKIWSHARHFGEHDLQTVFTKGPMMNASTSDVSSARFIFGFTMVAITDVLFLGIFTIWAMIEIDATLTFIALGTLLFLPPAIRWLSEREISRYIMAQEFLSKFNDLSSQVISTIRLQRMTQTGGFWKTKLEDAAKTYRDLRLNAVKTSLLFIPAFGFASLVSYAVLFTLGLKFVFDGRLTLGDFLAMQALIFLIQDPLFELGFIISEWRKGIASLQRLMTVFLHPREEYLYQKGENVKSDSDLVISLKDINFKYPGTPNTILSDFSLDLKKGEKIGIVGAIGTGKSTLVSIMSGLERRLISGDVKFYNRDFSYFSHDALRSHISVVPQKPFLFAETIAANVRMDMELTDEQIWHVLWVSGLDEDIRNFPAQLETPLGEWGINLSGGQKQRLTLARALARRPKVLFMDDCLSAVDTVTEEKILSRLNKELVDLTAVWVAHRESTLKYCDRIIRLEGDSV